MPRPVAEFQFDVNSDIVKAALANNTLTARATKKNGEPYSFVSKSATGAEITTPYTNYSVTDLDTAVRILGSVKVVLSAVSDKINRSVVAQARLGTVDHREADLKKAAKAMVALGIGGDYDTVLANLRAQIQ